MKSKAPDTALETEAHRRPSQMVGNYSSKYRTGNSKTFKEDLWRTPTSFPKPAGYAADGSQDVFLPGCLHLLPVDHFSGSAVCGNEIQNVLGSDVLDGRLEQGCARGSQADVSSDRSDDVCVRRLTHQMQCLPDAVFRNQVPPRRRAYSLARAASTL
jgi:hypothetical protein